MSALVLWMNIPLMVLVFGLMVGVPLWMVLRRPDRHPAETRTAPAYIVRQRPEAHGPASAAVARPAPGVASDRRRELVIQGPR